MILSVVQGEPGNVFAFGGRTGLGAEEETAGLDAGTRVRSVVLHPELTQLGQFLLMERGGGGNKKINKEIKSKVKTKRRLEKKKKKNSASVTGDVNGGSFLSGGEWNLTKARPYAMF